jgi:cyclic dehypoxanthinyl futalosine synthase
MIGDRVTSETVIDHRLQRLDELSCDSSKPRSLAAGQPGFVSLIPWTFQPDNTPNWKGDYDPPSGQSGCLRWLALSRLYLDNLPNVQVSWLTARAS